MYRQIYLFSFSLGLFLCSFLKALTFSISFSEPLNRIGLAYVFLGLIAGVLVFEWLPSKRVAKGVRVIGIGGILSGLIGILLPQTAWFLSLFIGLFCGYIFIKNQKNGTFYSTLGFFLLGLLSFLIVLTIFVDSEGLISQICFGLSSILLLYFLLKTPTLSYEGRLKSTDLAVSKGYHFAAWLAATFIIIIEVQWVFWHIVFYKSLFDPIPGVQILLVLFLLSMGRIFLSIGEKVPTSQGGIFTLSVVITIALGMMYTWSFVWVFPLFFVLGITYFIYKINSPYDLFSSRSGVVGTLLLLFVSFIIAGLYGQNHLNFIEGLKMSPVLWSLSFLQAWTKELASLAAITLVITGTVFLRPTQLS